MKSKYWYVVTAQKEGDKNIALTPNYMSCKNRAISLAEVIVIYSKDGAFPLYVVPLTKKLYKVVQAKFPGCKIKGAL